MAETTSLRIGRWFFSAAHFARKRATVSRAVARTRGVGRKMLKLICCEPGKILGAAVVQGSLVACDVGDGGDKVVGRGRTLRIETSGIIIVVE